MPKQIPLTQGLFAIVDDGDYEMLSKRNWFSMHARTAGKFYAATSDIERGGHLMMHRVLLGMANAKRPLVDHINRNGLDNRRENLRLCTHMQNLWNASLSKRSKTGFKGVTVRYGGFGANICKNYKQIRLGSFTTPEAAARAYDRAARELFGEFAYLNFPDEQSATAISRKG
jgi:hypothetical protein